MSLLRRLHARILIETLPTAASDDKGKEDKQNERQRTTLEVARNLFVESRRPIILRHKLTSSVRLELTLLSAPSRLISRINKLSSIKRYDHERLIG